MGHNSALLDEGTIKTAKNERCCRKPDVIDVGPVVLYMYADKIALYISLVAQQAL